MKKRKNNNIEFDIENLENKRQKAIKDIEFQISKADSKHQTEREAMLSIRRILNRLKTIEKNTFNVPINQSPLVPDSTEKLEESYKRLGVDLVDKLESTKIRKCNPHIDEFEGQEGG